MPKPRKKPRSLEILRLNRVSLVDKGDNPEAHILIHKRADEDPQEQADIKPEGEMETSLGEPTETKEGDGMDLEQITQEITTLKGTLAETAKRAERAEGILKLTTEERAVFDTLNAEQQTAYLAGDATVRKSFVPPAKEPTEIEKRLAAQEAENQRLAKRVAEAEERAELAEFTKRAETEYPNTPGKPEEKGRMLRDIEKLAEPARAAALAALKAGDAALATLAKSAGYSGRETANDAESKIEQAATEIMRTEKVSKGVAWNLAVERNPDLYREYTAERKGVN